MMPLPPPMHENFGYKNFFETQKGSHTKFFGTVRQKFWTKSRDTSSFSKNIEIIGGIDVCRKPPKTRFLTVVSFLTVCKCWSKYLYSGEKYAGASRPSCLIIQLYNGCYDGWEFNKYFDDRLSFFLICSNVISQFTWYWLPSSCYSSLTLHYLANFAARID